MDIPHVADKVLAILVLVLGCQAGRSDESDSLLADRTVIERIYYDHRLGNKPPFEQALPRATLQQLVRQDLQKEATLKGEFGVSISGLEVELEMRRINTTTRAPEMLTEIKAALGNDPARFARAVARPIVVDRELRKRFDNDNKVHQPRRKEAEGSRESLLAAKANAATVGQLEAILKASTNGVSQPMIWQLTPRPADQGGRETSARTLAPSSPSKGQARSSRYSIEASAQVTQVMSPPGPNPREREKFYFDDLPNDLRQVLRSQLRQPGDVSAVIETPQAFLLYLAKEINRESMTVMSWSIPKLGLEQWLAEQKFSPD